MTLGEAINKGLLGSHFKGWRNGQIFLAKDFPVTKPDHYLEVELDENCEYIVVKCTGAKLIAVKDCGNSVVKCEECKRYYDRIERNVKSFIEEHGLEYADKFIDDRLN